MENKQYTSCELAKVIAAPYNLLPKGVEVFVKKHGFMTYEQYAAWVIANKFYTVYQVHQEIMKAVLES